MNSDNYISYQIGLLVAILAGLVIILIIIMPIKNLDTNHDKCDEINRLMLDDPEHSKLHSDYPNILNDLHKYQNEKCDMKMDSDKDE
jgi:hypothetical protein